MRGKRKGENDRAAGKSNKMKDLWGRRPLSTWPHSAENKRLSRRIERRQMKHALAQSADPTHLSQDTGGMRCLISIA